MARREPPHGPGEVIQFTALTPSGGQVNHWRGRRTRDEAETRGGVASGHLDDCGPYLVPDLSISRFPSGSFRASLKKYVRKGLFLELSSGIVAIIAATFKDEVPFERDDLAGGNPWTWAGDRSAFARSETSPALPRSLLPRSSTRGNETPDNCEFSLFVSPDFARPRLYS